MAYHITKIINNSNRSVATTNPAYEADSRLVLPGTSYVPDRPILINKISGNPNYIQASATANNIYSSTDNFAFWDNTDSAVNGIGENGTPIVYNASAGNLELTVGADGKPTFLRV